LLNITPDHLVRHGGLEKYIEAKEEILKKAEETVVCLDTKEAEKLAKKYKDKTTQVSTEKVIPTGVYVKDGFIINDLSGTARRYVELEKLEFLKGKHNAQNIVIAFALIKKLGFCGRRATKAIYRFTGLAHRQEFVLEKENIRFINDSKATNAEATEPALKTFENIYLIAGGQAKEGGLELILPLMKKKVKAVFLIGDASDYFAEQIGKSIPTFKCEKLEKATKLAYEFAQKNESEKATVLLSPVCASWDQFDSFEARGDAYKKIVQTL
ncbi:MAG: UDP-N-acetylmuramoyl-L-alanine--D-glutamate ligase, partial [Alphaproteobacteria bacterium]